MIAGVQVHRRRERLLPFDPLLAAVVLLLLAASVVFVASASMSVSEVRYDDAWRIVRHWLVYMPIGLILMWTLSRIDVDWWRAMILPALAFGMLLLLLVLLPPFGRDFNGARRWFTVFGLTLQPVELIKPLVIIYMAYYMAAFPERLRRFSSGLAPMLVVLGVLVILLLLQPDFGNAALLVLLCFGMWFAGGVPLPHLALSLLVAAPVGVVILLAEPYRLQRIASFMDPWSDPFGSGYQLIQSMLAFGAGGIWGVGIGQGVQKLFYLPEPFTDFIASVVAEETGLVGTVALIVFFAVLCWRSLLLVWQVRDAYRRLLVLGCVNLLAATFLINMGAAMGILPTKGMPLPLMSYGGSALIGNCILLGLIFSVQRHLPQNVRKGAGS